MNAAERRHDEFPPAVFASAGHGQSPPRSETATARRALGWGASSPPRRMTRVWPKGAASGNLNRALNPLRWSSRAACRASSVSVRSRSQAGRPAARCGRSAGVRTQSRRRGEGTRYLSVGRGCGTKLVSCSTCRPPAPRASFAGRARGAERHSSMMIVSSTTRVARQRGAHHGAGTQGLGRAAGSHAWQSCFIPIRSSLGSCLDLERAPADRRRERGPRNHGPRFETT